jgi:hypothetical protein
MSPGLRPCSPYNKPPQQQQQHDTISFGANACGPNLATAAAAGDVAVVENQASLQLPTFLMPQLTEDALSAAPDNPLFGTSRLAAAVAQLPASSLWGKDTAESTCSVSNSSGGGMQAAVLLPASLQEQASGIASVPHVPMLPVDEGAAAQDEAAAGSSSSSSSSSNGSNGSKRSGPLGAHGSMQQQNRGSQAAQQNSRRNATPRISTTTSSVVLPRSNKSLGSARNRKGTAGATATAVAAAAAARPGLLLQGLSDGLDAQLCDGSSSGSIADAAAADEASAGGGRGSWLWLRSPQVGADLSELARAAKP